MNHACAVFQRRPLARSAGAASRNAARISASLRAASHDRLITRRGRAPAELQATKTGAASLETAKLGTAGGATPASSKARNHECSRSGDSTADQNARVRDLGRKASANHAVADTRTSPDPAATAAGRPPRTSPAAAPIANAAGTAGTKARIHRIIPIPGGWYPSGSLADNARNLLLELFGPRRDPQRLLQQDGARFDEATQRLVERLHLVVVVG